MEISELIKHPVLYFFLSGLSVSFLYVISRTTFRKWKNNILLASVLILIIGILVFIFGEGTAAFAPFLFIPLYSTIVTIFIEYLYYTKYDKQLPDTSFWYITTDKKSSRDNNWNTMLLLVIIIVPIAACMYTLIFL